jgi:predicted esterase
MRNAELKGEVVWCSTLTFTFHIPHSEFRIGGAMQEHHIEVARSARYFTLGGASPAGEVWFVCHGYGQLAARFLRHFEPVAGETRLVVAPEGLSRFYLSEDPAERRVGASWMTREDRLTEIEDYVRYLDAVYQNVFREAGLDQSQAKVVALGYSQGAAAACRWAAMGASSVDRLIVWGGEVPPDLDLATAAARLRVLRLALVYGHEDEFFTPKIVASTEARLREHGIPYSLVPFVGGHEIDQTALRRLVE